MMCKKAGCTLYAELEEKEDLSGCKRIMEEKIEQCEKDLQRIAHNGGMTEEDLIREAERYNPDDLSLWIEGLNQQIAEKDEELSKIAQIIGSEAKELEKMNGAPAQPRHQKI